MFRIFNKRLTLTASVLAVLLLASLSVRAQDGGTLVVALTPIAGTLDPHFNTNDPDTALARALFDYFVEPLPDGTVGPNLAASWEISEDELTYTFTVVEGVTFHDGTPLTSADVVWTYNRLRDPEVGTPAVPLLASVAEIAAPDDATVVFTLSAPTADFLVNLANRWALVVKADSSDFSAEALSAIGTGPFVLDSYSPGDRAQLSAYSDYWMEGAPLLSNLTFIYQADPAAQVDALRSGQANFIFKIPAELALVLQRESNITVEAPATSAHPVVRLRTDQGPGTDVRVRQALKLATDREALNEIVNFGDGTVGNNDPIGPVFADLFPGNLDSPYAPDQACALLEEAGYGSPARLELTLHGPDALGYGTLATVLQEQWQDGCIFVDINIQPEGVYYDGPWLDVDLGITGWGPRATPQQYLEEAYLSTGPFNESQWNDEELDALIIEARSVSGEERQVIYAQIAAIFAERGPILVPYFIPVYSATTANVQGLVSPPYSGLTDWRTVSVQP